MNGSHQETFLLTTETSQFSISPGEKLEIPVYITNQGSTQDRLRISVDGIPMVWVSTGHQVVLLQPGEERQIKLTIQPPAPPNVQVGRYKMRLLTTSEIDSSHTAQTQVTLTVAGFEVKGRVGVLLEGVQYAVIPDYFSIPTHTGLDTITGVTPDNPPLNVKLSGTNTAAIAGSVTSIEITVVDVSGRCPDKYQQAVPYTAASKKDGWDEGSNTYYKYMASE